jgi:hypothetical protein
MLQANPEPDAQNLQPPEHPSPKSAPMSMPKSAPKSPARSLRVQNSTAHKHAAMDHPALRENVLSGSPLLF